MRHRGNRLGLLLACALGLSACSYGVSYPVYIGSYTPDMVVYTASRGGMLTEIHGNPFAASRQKLEAAVTESLFGSHFGPDMPFFTKAPENYQPPYRVVMAFNRGRGLGGAGACRLQDNAGEDGGPTAEINVIAAFCDRETRITSTGGSISGVTGPDDPKFRRFIAQLGILLFPPFDPERRGSGDFETKRGDFKADTQATRAARR